MQKLCAVIGLPVLELETGMQIGVVHEVVMDFAGASVKGVVVNNPNWFSDGQGIAFSELFRIGRDAVTVRNNVVMQELSVLGLIEGMYQLHDVVGKQIFTESGVNLGLLVDVMFDTTTGELKDYEVSDGLLTDLVYGRMTMPLPQAQVISEDRIIVPESMAKLLQAE